MNLREKIKSYSFWVSLGSAIILILKVLGTRFGFHVDETMISDLFTALCSILVIMGIIVIPQPKDLSKPTTTIDNIIQSNQVAENNPQTFIEENTKEVEIENKLDDNTVICNNTQNENNEQVIECYPNKNDRGFSQIETNIESVDILPNVTQSESETVAEYSIAHDVITPVNEELLTVIKQEKEKFSDNLDEFIMILQDEINSIKTKEEA